MVIDDEADIRFLLKAILSHKKISSVAFGDMKSAYDFLSENQADPDFFFIDNRLENDLGVRHLRNLKTKYPDSILVMISAYDTKADQEVAFIEGADYFIGKPFTPQQIYDLVGKSEDNS